MSYLIDTCVISELRKPDPSPEFLGWFQSCKAEHLFISSLTLGELYYGISILPKGKKRDDLFIWFNEVRDAFGDNILTVNDDTGIMWGELRAKAKNIGKPMPVIDGLLAATAITNKLALVTRNIEDFQITGLQILNPWQE